MKREFVKTDNARRFATAIQLREARGAAESGLVVVHGRAGEGKTRTLHNWASTRDAVMLTAYPGWTPHRMMCELDERMSVVTRGNWQATIAEQIAEGEKPLVVDEAGFALADGAACLERLRTITDKSGRTLSGQNIEAFAIAVAHAKPISIGINCSLGAAEMRPFLEALARVAPIYVSAYPNAGLPNAFGAYDQTPDQMALLVHDFATSGFVNMLGGCCGSTPDHIAKIAAVVRDVAPRKIPVKTEHFTEWAGLEPCIVRPETNFIMVGERTNITG